jgi:translation initiation factor 3 subunit M
LVGVTDGHSCVCQCFHGKPFESVPQPHVQLLRIVCHGTADELAQFYSSSPNNKKLIDESGLNYAEMLHTQQLLSICNFAATKSTASYKEIADYLKISEDEVEIWIVEAISSGLVEANMNQLAGSVTFRFVLMCI